MIGLHLWRKERKAGDAMAFWNYLPGVRTWDDPTWRWAIQIPLPFGLTIRLGRGGRT